MIAVLESVKLVLDIDPKPQSRPRFARDGRTYTDPKTRTYRMALEVLLIQALRGRSLNWTGPVDLALEFEIAMPASWTPVQRAERDGTPHATRPDLDNLAKAIEDSARGIIYQDDAQVVSLRAVKRWATRGSIIIEARQVEHAE